ncbi:MAG: GntR family transcriptional regulator [Longicatena sp.]|jgi:GntR family transcriptional regulator|uniref:GntR family transcriptional regulator n=1 Tax=Anaerorhabdus sp. TaxID=1872524 RepID=UPI002FC6C997
MNESFNKIPLYCRLAELIEEQINSGILKKGQMIPSERELCKIHGMSRITVRMAIDELVRQGKLEKIQGKGTFVLSKSIIQNLGNVYSFSKEMDKQGKISSNKIINRSIVSADAKIASHLGITEGEQVVFIERLRCAEDVAIMLEKTYFVKEKYEFLLNIDFSVKGLYKTLEEDYQIMINRAIETFKATELNTVECRLLNCPKKQYGLLVKRTSYSNDKIVCYSTIVSKGDVFEFTVKLES